jgi:SprT protein
MPKKEVPLHSIQSYLPPGTADAVISSLEYYHIHLTISRKRSTVLGDYRHRAGFKNHRISVNGNLNAYAFLLTYLHELAHLLTFEQFGKNVYAHGNEWKRIYASLLKKYLEQKVFPEDIEKEIRYAANNPAASSCAETGLMRVLRKYDKGRANFLMVEEIGHQAIFKTEEGRLFQKGEKLRKRFKCREIKTGQFYLFSPVHEVELVNTN